MFGTINRKEKNLLIELNKVTSAALISKNRGKCPLTIGGTVSTINFLRDEYGTIGK